MTELRGGACLAHDLVELGFPQPAAVRHLQGHESVELRVTRLPHRAESALAQSLKKLEAAQRLTDQHIVAIDSTCRTCPRRTYLVAT
jgi:hypothetical protein